MEIEDSWILQTLLENTADSIYIKDRQCRIWKFSKKFANDMHVSDPLMICGKTDIDFFGEEFGKKTMKDDLEVMETGIAKEGIIDQYISSKGRLNWTSSTKLPLKNDKGEIVGLLGITREINDLKTIESDYLWKATHDPLTSLPNRVLLIDRITQLINKGDQANNSFALLFIDLNGFKNVNDLYGHNRGDLYLVRLAEGLSRLLRSTDLIARYGGDEFIVLLDKAARNKKIEKVVKKIADYIYNQVDPDNHAVSASIGISFFPEDGIDAKSLINVADQNMYEAKRRSIPFIGCDN
jgi:diguanylate cyclase (GGDEF)-like protein